MLKQGFDNDKYIELQSEKIRERISKFGGKLYLEFGGKLFDDYHASRVLPGFKPDSKINMLKMIPLLWKAMSKNPRPRRNPEHKKKDQTFQRLS